MNRKDFVYAWPDGDFGEEGFATEEDAITHAMANETSCYDSITVAERHFAPVSDLVPTGRELLHFIDENNQQPDGVGAEYRFCFDATAEAEQELTLLINNMMEGWLTRHGIQQKAVFTYANQHEVDL